MISHTLVRFSWLLLYLALAGGCATAQKVRMEQYESTVRAYESSLRWSEFANAYVLTGKSDVAAFDSARLKHIRVVSYDKLSAPLPNEETTEISQTVEISYVHISNMSERRITDRQTWVYSEKRERWILHSAFPKFP